MTDRRDDDLKRRAAAYARDAARVVRESGVPRHREKALADLMNAEATVGFESAMRKLADKILADPDRYSVQDRKRMVRAALAAAGERIRATIREQIAAWKAEEREGSQRERDSA
jgi:3-methyladenine DNA glycosylase Tag